jgi:hypothetical protein
LQFTTRYTFSKSLDNLSSTFSEASNNFNLGLLDPFNPLLDYGPSDFDVRHRFAASFNLEVPFDKLGDFDSGWGKQLVSGWELTGIFTARTGTPFSIFDCTNALSVCSRLLVRNAIDSNGADNPAPDPLVPNRFAFIDLTGQPAGTFINPITGTSDFGPFPASMSGRNAFRAPGFWNLDAGLYKRFAFSEDVSLQFRAEFYNVFNHANLFVRGDEADISTTSFVPAFFSGRRHVQLALKLIF